MILISHALILHFISQRWFINGIYTYLHKIKAWQQREAVLGWFLLGLAFGRHHLGVGPVAACRESVRKFVTRFRHQYFTQHKNTPLILAPPTAQNCQGKMLKINFSPWGFLMSEPISLPSRYLISHFSSSCPHFDHFLSFFPSCLQFKLSFLLPRQVPSQNFSFCRQIGAYS